MSFFEKKNQKTFPRWSLVSARYHLGAQSAREKFFGSFFQKRTAFLSF
jgi:hypothetical protein